MVFMVLMVLIMAGSGVSIGAPSLNNPSGENDIATYLVVPRPVFSVTIISL